MEKGTIVKIIVAVAVVAGGWWWFTRRNGEEDFQRAMESMKTVRSFRAQIVSSDGQTTLIEHECPSSARTKSPDSEQIQVGTEMYYRYAGSWTRSGEPVEHPDLVCTRLSTGQQTDPFPPLVELSRRGLMKQGSVVKVGEAKCREWHLQIVHPLGTRKEIVCLGTDDFLPIQWTVEGSTTTYSDFNKPMNIRAPEAAAGASEN